MTDLARLLEAAEAAARSDRIEWRDPIAAHGREAVPPLTEWLSDDRLGRFAVRTLERIASDSMNRGVAVKSLVTVDRTTTPVSVAAEIDAALARLGVARPRAQAGTVHPFPRSDWPGSRRVSELELRFHEDMLAIFRLAGEATRIPRPDGTMQRGYWPSYFLRGVRNHGGPEYAHQLLRKTGTTPGFERLRQEGRLELTVEALVLRPKYAPLFTQEERRIAAHRLAGAGYLPPEA